MGRNTELAISRDTGLTREAVHKLVQMANRADTDDNFQLSFISELICNRDLTLKLWQDYSKEVAEEFAKEVDRKADARLSYTARLLRAKMSGA